jgi:hypothetical protein
VRLGLLPNRRQVGSLRELRKQAIHSSSDLFQISRDLIQFVPHRSDSVFEVRQGYGPVDHPALIDLGRIGEWRSPYPKTFKHALQKPTHR